MTDRPAACCGGLGAAIAAVVVAQIILTLVIVALVIVGAVAIVAYATGWRPFGYPDEYLEKRDAFRGTDDHQLVVDHVDAAGDRSPTGGAAFDRLHQELADRGHGFSERELEWLIEDELDRRDEG